MAEFTKFPYRSEFPDSSERAGRHQTLEDALSSVRWTIYRVWREDCEYGRAGEPTNDADVAVITNRNTGYRWILRRTERVVEFQTPKMLEDQAAAESIELHLSVEEAEALAVATQAAIVKDKRVKALRDQALDQIGYVCRRVRERVRLADTFIDSHTSSIPRKDPSQIQDEAQREAEPAPEPSPRPSYPLCGDPDLMSLKEVGEILGKARSTIHNWYKQGKFPPAVDTSGRLRKTQPVIVVPRYRFEAWRASERMPAILDDVFETHPLREPHWACFTVKKGAGREDIEFWLDRRSLKKGLSKDGKQIYAPDLEDDKRYDLVRPTSAGV